jgi:adenine deaminase
MMREDFSDANTEPEVISCAPMEPIKIAGHIVDIEQRRIYDGELILQNGTIQRISSKPHVPDQYILPGFIDAHVHIESSMVIPSEFARMAVVHGTVATVSDPHEIANVLGVKGVEFMINNGKQVPFKFYFGAPSCVPATTFETSGATVGVSDVRALIQKPEIKYLAEMMNWPGVLHGEKDVYDKIAAARQGGKVVDGHAPGLKGEDARKYAAAGITTDHECFSADEALDKLASGMKIIIREGSAAKNFDALVHLLNDHYDNMMFCSDDKHPDSLEAGHINLLVRRAIDSGIDVFKVLKAACINAIDHYSLGVGKLRPGDPGDFIIVSDLVDFKVLQTFVDGQMVAESGRTRIASVKTAPVNNFKATMKQPSDFKVWAPEPYLRVIVCADGQLVTGAETRKALIRDGHAISDIENDILKISVVNRYDDTPVSSAFIRNFNLKRGAIASCVAHDSHNIIAVGVDDESICRAVNMIINARGGISAVDGKHEKILPLPVAGIMSDQDGYAVADAYKLLDAMAKEMGSLLSAPFMTLSFMALLVIPSLKLSDKGLFDGGKFQFEELFRKSPGS